MSEATIRRISMQLTALSESGLAYSRDRFDIERFHEIGALANELLSLVAAEPVPEYRKEVALAAGYSTPKVDVRGAIFNDDACVLLAKERLDEDRWTLPGGWCDILEPPHAAVEREVREEVGVDATAYHLALLIDRESWPHTPKYDRSIYKLFFLCRANSPVDLGYTSAETSEVGWFDVDDLPDLSVGRVLPEQLHMLREHWRHPESAYFD